MGRKALINKEDKLQMVLKYLKGDSSITELARSIDTHQDVIRRWVNQYGAHGASVFDRRPKNQTYDIAFKRSVIEAYINGDGSEQELALKYGIRSSSTLHSWILKYNRHEKIKDYDPKGDVYMAKSRKVSYEEKIEVIEYCIKNHNSYKHAAEKYQIPYSQVYMWVKKYQERGPEGLLDRRGRTKLESELTDLEVKEREIELLKRKNAYLEMENEVLKKFQALERRSASEKHAKKTNIKQ